ncbi:MAG TPA: SCO family protein [Gammaproteobacteria bacterium]|nr:SCO family protein [Gammaproteobacteria bacterium]
MSIKTKALIGLAAVVAMSGGFWLSQIQQSSIETDTHDARQKALADARRNFSPIQGSILSPARKISVPVLNRDDGTDFTIEDLKGKWHLIFFGYTHCPDVCPVTLGAVAQAKKMAAVDEQTFPEVVFISVDPERDKVEMLAEYVQYFDKDFIGVTGDEKMIQALTLQMSVVYMKMPVEEGASGYIVDHSAALLLLDPEGRLVAFLNPPHDPATILKDFQTVVDQYQ